MGGQGARRKRNWRHNRPNSPYRRISPQIATPDPPDFVPQPQPPPQGKLQKGSLWEDPVIQQDCPGTNATPHDCPGQIKILSVSVQGGVQEQLF
eukprot:634390-Pelagomonas_calceolata.AAC.1